MVTLIADMDGAKFISHSRNDTIFTKMLNKDRFKLTLKLTPKFYTYLIREKVLHRF